MAGIGAQEEVEKSQTSILSFPNGSIGNMVYVMRTKQYYVYIMSSKQDGMLYIGVTSDLIKRVYEHKNDLADGFTNNYHIHNLVYFEVTNDVQSAISREKQLKKWNRAWKVALIEKSNPEWLDLYCDDQINHIPDRITRG